MIAHVARPSIVGLIALLLGVVLLAGARPRTVRGTLVPGSCELRAGEHRFRLASDAEEVRVRYAGVLPDAFFYGGTLTVSGVRAGGVLRAATVIARCPTKYETSR